MIVPEGEGATASAAQLSADEGLWSIALSGELDLASAPMVRPTFDDVIAKCPRRVVVDLAALSFMDSTGIALVLEAASRVPRLEVANVSPIVRAVMESMGLSSMLTILP